MPNYTFCCADCGETAVLHRPFSVGPSPEPCPCGGRREHDFCTDVASVELDTAGCRDHNFIKRNKRVFRNCKRSDVSGKEAAYAGHVKDRRKQLREGGNQGKIRQTMAIPADLYHGKIRETKDRNYWDDRKNVSRHSDFKVDG